jgi:hypothetical protein
VEIVIHTAARRALCLRRYLTEEGFINNLNRRDQEIYEFWKLPLL